MSVDEFNLCDVSFLEMAIFLENSFEMPSQEAEVVAYRLKGMFSRFSLPAHPSLFCWDTFGSSGVATNGQSAVGTYTASPRIHF
jgi:hypothetical protein